MAEDVTNGLIVAGISEAVSGLTGNLGVPTAQKREKTPENTQIVMAGDNTVW